MGIKDLLRFLKPYVEPIHIKKYAGKRVNFSFFWILIGTPFGLYKFMLQSMSSYICVLGIEYV